MNSASPIVANQLELITEVSLERAFEIADTMIDPLRTNLKALTIFSGECVEYGSIHVVILPIGNPVLLPFASLHVSV